MQDQETIIAHVQARFDVAPFARKVGAWVWVEFPSRPPAETIAFLKTEGFHWNKKRAAWQHSCGVRRRFNPRSDPRLMYGEVPIEPLVSAEKVA